MFLFLRLILGHFTGDFLFQSDEVYEVKKKGFSGALIHYFIIFATFILLSFPYLKHPGCWLVIIFASLTHIVQDEIKLRYITAPRFNLAAFLADQVFHVLFLLPIFLFDFAYLPAKGDNILIRLYNNDALMIFGSGYIVSIFMGAYVWEAFKISWFKKMISFTPFNLRYGMFERFLITTSFITPCWAILLITIPVFRFILKERLSVLSGFTFNLFYAGAIGFILSNFYPVF